MGGVLRGMFLTKRLSLVQDKLLGSHWDEAKTQVTGERARAQMRAPMLRSLKSSSFTDVVLFFLKDAAKP